MLGRLHIPIERCIELYEGIASDVFVKRIKQKSPFKWVTAETGHSWFNAKDLNKKLLEILAEHGLDELSPLRQEDEPSCRVYVRKSQTL